MNFPGWLQVTELGEFHLFCAKFCGTDHARMGQRSSHGSMSLN